MTNACIQNNILNLSFDPIAFFIKNDLYYNYSYPHKMSLPSELWRIILQNITDKKSCKNLFKALPPSIQTDIEDDYVKHYAIFKKLICLAITKEIVIYYKDKAIKSLKLKDYIYNVRFRPNSNQIIFSDSQGDIFLWDYLTNNLENLIRSPRGRLTPLITPIVKIYFHISLCGKFMIVHPFPIQDHQLYKFDIDQKKKTIIPFFIESYHTSFTVKFNPITDEFTLLSYYFREVGRFQLKINILNCTTLVSKYFTNLGYYAPYYDELGNLFVAKKNKGIYKLVNYETFEEIFNYSEYITYFIVKNGIIYYIDNISISSTINIRIYNILKKENKDIFYILSFPYESVYGLQISKNNRKLIFSSDIRIIFLDVESKNITKIITRKQDPDEYSKERNIVDFCVKNF